jgi:hypothetical protein
MLGVEIENNVFLEASMSGISRRLFGVMAVAALGCLVCGSFVRGEDAPTTAPAAATGTIKGVVSSGGSPVAGATVRLLAPPKRHLKPAASTNDTPATGTPADPNAPAPADAPPEHHRPKALQTTTTGADGSYTFTNVAAGDYVVWASLKGTGRGREKATVTADATTTVNITLEAVAPKPAN